MDQQVPTTRDAQVSSTQSNGYSSVATLNTTAPHYYGTNDYMEQDPQHWGQIGHSFNAYINEQPRAALPNFDNYSYGYSEPSHPVPHGQSFPYGSLAGQTQPVSSLNASSNYYGSNAGIGSMRCVTHAHNANVSQPPFVAFSEAASPMFNGQTSHPNGTAIQPVSSLNASSNYYVSNAGIESMQSVTHAHNVNVSQPHQNQLPEVQSEEDSALRERKMKSAKISKTCRKRKNKKFEKSRETSSEELKLAEHFLAHISNFHGLHPNYLEYLYEFGAILKENALLLISCHEHENEAPTDEVEVKAQKCLADNNNFIARWPYLQDEHQYVPQLDQQNYW
ncbi:hypothetical protein DdX_18205 [Ditylenchus destructor]|uniref:Uncharacterized protein n=1 Tax=Ditylenchus destructor TaxID=166010 RepID=A0AAD4QYI0_9BILA|nr:hypothetical protein DdX_18205 [Ditylenchus destructor]